MQYLRGTVTKNTQPSQSGLLVRAIHRETGLLLGSTTASTIDGSYTIELPAGDLAGKIVAIVTDEAPFLNAQPRAHDKLHAETQTIWLLDSFTGPNTDSLATHIGEVGATWRSLAGVDHGPITDMVLTGTGETVISAGGHSWADMFFTSIGQPASTNWTLETAFSMEQSAGTMSVCFCTQGELSDLTSTFYQLVVHGHSVWVSYAWHVAGVLNWSTVASTVLPSDWFPAGVHTIKIDVEGFLKRISFDNVVILNFTHSLVPAIGIVWFSPNSLAVIDNVYGYDWLLV
jgi:hypothetical protein